MQTRIDITEPVVALRDHLTAADGLEPHGD